MLYPLMADEIHGGDLDDTVSTYSVTSESGLNDPYEEEARHYADGRAFIDPAVTSMGGTKYYKAPDGASQAGAHFATSNDGL
jgi:hypothetical protein